MPQSLETIVQRMIDANEPEENIASVIKEFNKPTNIKEVPENAPDDWKSGFINSITSGDALNSGISSLGGYAKGIPKGIWGGLKSAGNLALASSGPLGELITGKSPLDRGKEFIDTVTGIPNAIKGMANTTIQSGNNPEAFGEMMGELTGAPLVSAGLVRGTPMATRLGGYPVELMGKGLQKYPLTGWVPFARTAIPNVRRLDRSLISGPIGRGIESVGKMMKDVGKEGLTSETMPVISEGEDLTPKNYKVIRNESTPVNKPKFRTNNDGTFTNLETGEVLDSKGQSIVEINGKTLDMNKTLDKNSPFFTRNRRP